MSFLIKDNKLLEKYEEIWNKFTMSILLFDVLGEYRINKLELFRVVLT